MKRRSTDVIIVQSAVLGEIAEDLREEGLDESAAIIDGVVSRLDLDDDPYDRVRAVVVDLQTIYHRLREAALNDAQREQAESILTILRRLRRAVDRELHDTQPIDLDDAPSRRRDTPGKS